MSTGVNAVSAADAHVVINADGISAGIHAEFYGANTDALMAVHAVFFHDFNDRIQSHNSSVHQKTPIVFY
jgi:hypothetical protein